MQGASASAVIVLTQKSWNIPASALVRQERVRNENKYI